ncbi:MAG TPA: CehA/McbA family metallohydrolase [Gaiellaceae bacterium]|nr:CehA/McbA family metallohydrolase [Gaiellaceae bacterium]
MSHSADPFAATGPWLKCALHAHTTRSDGDLTPEELVDLYARAGFDVLAITDHWLRTEASSTERLLVIPSSELSCLLPDGGHGHLLGIGIDVDPMEFVRTRPDLAAASAWVAGRGGVAFLAHPYWTGAAAGGLELCDGLAGIEVYNAGCELETGRGLSTVHWDELLARGSRCYGIAADDCHRGEVDSRFAWVWARVREHSQAAVLEALATGSFYSSTGPTIEALTVEDGTIEVRCSPCARVTLCTEAQRGASVGAGATGYRFRGEALSETDAGELTRVRLQRPRVASFGRVELVDACGRKAWTNPLW